MKTFFLLYFRNEYSLAGAHCFSPFVGKPENPEKPLRICIKSIPIRFEGGVVSRIKRPVEIFPGLKMIENAVAKIEENPYVYKKVFPFEKFN